MVGERLPPEGGERGALQAYEVADEFGYALNCHCSDCRKATGCRFKPFGGIEREKLKITEGEEDVSVFGDRSANHDIARCAACGSLLYSVVRDGTICPRYNGHTD